MCYVTQERLDDFIKTRDQRAKRLLQLKEQQVEAPIKVASTTHRDDGMSDDHAELRRQIGVEEQHIQKLNELIRKAIVVPVPTNTDRLLIGTVGVIQRYDEEMNPLGKEERYLVGSFESSDMKTKPPTLSYDSPILSPFFGQSLDPEAEPVETYIGGKLIHLELKRIELQAKVVPIRQAS